MANELIKQPATGLASSEAEAVLSSSSDAESDGGPSTPNDYLSTALYLFNIPCNNESEKGRAYAAISKYLRMTVQEDLLKEITHYRVKRSRKTRDKREELENQAKRAYYGARSRCLNSLSFSEMGYREANIERPAGDTCTWIYDNSVYQCWERESNTLLWIKGKPGSGKSTLMKSLFMKRQGLVANPADVHLSFFFNARGSAVEKAPVGLYITLLHNLLHQMPLTMCEFLPVFLEKEPRGQNEKVSWQLAEVANFFHTIIGQKQPGCIEIMVDALDECHEEEVRQVIRRFEASIADARASGAELRVCWSSRYYPNISLQSERGLELQLDEQNNADIRKYVEFELPDGKDSTFPSIREELISRANGVFLWAVLVSKQLIRGVDQGKDEAQLKELFRSIPAELDDLFDDIFSNTAVCSDERQDLIRVAQWIFCAFRPLGLRELSTALSVQASNTPIAIADVELSFDSVSRLKKRIVHLSGGLFEVVGSFGVVQVIHESIREFFLGPKGLQLLRMSSRELFMTLGHKALALGCFQALLAKEFDRVLETPNMTDSGVITDVWEFLTVRWKPPYDDFLEKYVRNFVFEHFDLSRDQFRSEYSPESPFESLKARKRVVQNFLRLWYSQHKLYWPLGAKFIDHMQKVSADPAAFDLSNTELSGLRAFMNNLSSASLFFNRRHIFMRDPILARAEPKRETFLALFYLYPRWKEANILLSAFFTAPEEEQDRGSYASEINFCFGMTFRASRVPDPAALLRQICSWSKLDSPRMPMVLQDWKFAENIEEFDEFREYKSVLRSFPKAKIHEYPNPSTLCLLLRRPSKKLFLKASGSTDADSDSDSNSEPDDEDSLPEEVRRNSRGDSYKHKFVLGYGRGSLPKDRLWRR